MAGSPLLPTELNLSGERLTAEYLVSGDEARAETVVRQLVVEQTIEFPPELVPDDDIKRHIVGHVVSKKALGNDQHAVRISFATEIVGSQLPQLINVLFGNISMVPGVRLIDIALPSSLLSTFEGPRNGIDGLRSRFDRPFGPLLGTALKPMGTPVDRLADMAYQLAMGGIQLIKDDHSFATQPFAEFEHRVPILSDAVARANAEGADAVYLPALNLPMDRLREAAEFAIEHGAGGLLVLPGVFGHDTMRWLAEMTPSEVIIMAHPSMLGSLVGEPSRGIAHHVVFGTLARLAGADVSIFPNHGGRFSFHPDDCVAVARACREPLDGLGTAWPAPAGGMSVERVEEMIDFYGEDVCLLIGGDLYRGDIGTQVGRMVEAIGVGER